MNENISYLAAQLNKLDIQYFLLTDYEADLSSRDIDLFVYPASKNNFEKLLHRLGWYKRKELPQHLNHHFYYSPDLEICLDVKYTLTFVDGHHSCYAYKPIDEAARNLIMNKAGLYRPSGIHAVLLYAAHVAYKERGKLEEKHKNYLSLYLSLYNSEFSEQFNPIAIAIKDWIENRFPIQTEELKQIIAPYFIHSQYRMVRSSKIPKYGYGMKILFLGTDGAGKTTLIQAVEESLNFKAKSLYLGMGENGWTHSLSKRIYNYKFKVLLLNKGLSFLKTFVLLPTEFILRIAPVKLRSKFSIVLIDRFPGAILLGRSLSSIIYKVILPSPDLVVFLYADPEVLVKRKPEEVTIERSKADILKFRQLAEKVSRGNYLSIDTSNLTVNNARDQIISAIYKNPKMHQNLLVPVNS